MRILALLLCLAALSRAAEPPAEAPEEPAPRPAKPWSPPRLKPTASRYDSFGMGAATTTARVSTFQPPASPKPSPKTTAKPEPIKVPTAAEIGAQVKDEVKVPLTPFEWPAKVEPKKQEAKAGEVTITIPEMKVEPPKRPSRALFAFLALSVVPVGSVDANGKPRVPYCAKGFGVAPGVSPKACCELGQFVCGRKGCAESCDHCGEARPGAECVPVSEPDPNYFDDTNYFRGGKP